MSSSDLKTYFQMGANLANKRGIGRALTQKYPESAQRSVTLYVLRPNEDVAQNISDWLKLYVEKRLRPDAVVSVDFSLYLDSASRFVVGDAVALERPTVKIYVDEELCWAIAARQHTIYSGYFMGKNVRVDGNFVVRDIALMDEILQMFYEAMRDQGFDIAELFAEVHG